MKGLKAAVKAINKARSIAVSGHINPDGDSIGSTLSLGLGLRLLGKQVCMISPDGVPKRYRSLPGSNRIATTINRAPDLAISVDCGSSQMLGKPYEILKTARQILEIDHHAFRRPFGDITLIDRRAAAVGEIIFSLLNELGVDITNKIAQNLITSIVVETNSFRLPNTRPLTFEICADLMRRGANFYNLVDTIFWSKTPAAAILSGICMSRCAFRRSNRLVWSIVRNSDLIALGAKDEDADPVPDQMRSIEPVKVAILFREKDDGTLRVSLRSKGKVNVAGIAERHNGGGHFDVAGCFIPNRNESIKEFIMEAEHLLD